MNSPQPAQDPAVAAPRAHGRIWTRRLVNAGVTLVVIAVAGATFVFSYAGVHAIALLGGMSAQLARYYPGLFDAVLVIACICAVVLRDGRWWARLWAWASIIIVLGAIGVADVLHAMGYALRHRPTEGIVAVAPVVAVLMAFSLLLTLLRQSRAHAPAAPAATPADLPALPAAVSVLPIALPAAPVEASPAEPQDVEQTATAPVPAMAVPAEPPDEPAPPTVEVPVVTASPAPSHGIRYAGSLIRNTPPSPDYWDAADSDTEQFAGLVYRARDDEGGNDALAGGSGSGSGSAVGPSQPELDDDAPPFATAPFAPMPRLNRVRSMPTPPADEDEDEDE